MENVKFPRIPHLPWSPGRANAADDKVLTSTTNKIAGKSGIGGPQEGLVIWPFSAFADQDFAAKVAKWVRKDHVQTDEHWLNRPIVNQEIL